MLSAFSGLQIRRAYRLKQESTKHGSATTLSAPRLWLKCWVLFRKDARGGTPLTPGGLGRRRRQPPLGPGRTTTPARLRPPSQKNGRAGAHTAHTRHLFRARTRRAHGASPGAQPARLARATGASCTHSRRVSRRAERRVSRRAERRVSRRAERRVFRRAERRVSGMRTSASSGPQTARLCGVRSVCFLNLSVLILLLCDLSGWATFALNHRLSAVVRES